MNVLLSISYSEWGGHGWESWGHQELMKLKCLRVLSFSFQVWLNRTKGDSPSWILGGLDMVMGLLYGAGMEARHNIIVVADIRRYSGRQRVGHSGECGTVVLYWFCIPGPWSQCQYPVRTPSMTLLGHWLLFISARLVYNKASLISDLIIDERINLTHTINTRLDPVGGKALS